MRPQKNKDIFLKLIGKRKNFLKVLKIVRRGNRDFIKCECICKKIKFVDMGNLKSESIKSCGCMRVKLISKARTTHGGGRSYLYRVWYNGRRRCQDRNSADYKYYGGRGIKWQFSSFEEFRDCILSTIGHRPSKKYSLDRKNNNGHYCYGNLRWATRLDQALNRRIRKNKKTSVYPGVSKKTGRNKWKASVANLHVGYFKTERAAFLAYLNAYRQYYGRESIHKSLRRLE